MNTELIADLSAKVLKRVLAFAAVRDVRYYLCGAHVLPGVKHGNLPARISATNGHMFYAEEDKSAVVSRELIVQIGLRGRGLLTGENRVKVYADNAVHITDSYGEPLYIEPGKGVVEGKFPAIEPIVGVPTDWHEGLRAPCNTQYLKAALSLPGAIRFFSKKDPVGEFSTSSAVMFVMEGGTGNGGKAMGLIMPLRSKFDINASVADMVPATLMVRRMTPAEAA
jgi:hypothetical protein